MGRDLATGAQIATIAHAVGPSTSFAGSPPRSGEDQFLPGTGRGTISAKTGMVEGSSAAGREAVRHHAFEICQHIASGNPQRLKTKRRQHRIPPRIAFRPIAPRMRLAINLDCYPPFKTSEIDNKPVARILAAKAEAAGVMAKLVPQQNFGQRHLAAEGAGLAGV